MASTGLGFWLSKVATPVEKTPGESGYFSAPSQVLDPRLFGSTEKVRSEVRHWILRTLYDYWEPKYHNPKVWSTVWLAGSGISYQWSADRGNGDLDVLIGIDFPLFFRYNDRYLGFGEDDVADMINQDLHQGLWPRTNSTEIGSVGPPHEGGTADVFEVTFYVNPRSTDIRDINPYAAYNVTEDEWTVRPPVLSQNPAQAFPQPFWDAANTERRYADSLIQRYNQVASQIGSQQVNSPAWHNTSRQLEVLTSQASTLFDSIHLGRRNAFGPGGSGYGDYYNFRWQFHKRGGTVQALDGIAHQRSDATDQADTGLYGAPLSSAHQALLTAATWNSQ